MTFVPLKILHVSPRVRGQGGMETQLARHAKWDAVHGLDASQLALFDPKPVQPDDSYATQAFSWRNTPVGMRRSMRQAFGLQPGKVVVWHNAWGLPWFGDIDGSVRRIVYLHANESYFRSWLPGLGDWIDGVVCDNLSAAKAAAKLLPALEPERIVGLLEPISPPPDLDAERPAGTEWIIGCAGRLVREQKRWDRLLPFVAELKRLGVPFRLEVVGEGPLRPWLEQRLRGEANATFFGWLQGEEYWRRLKTWEAALFFSDYEGIPIVLVETLAAGVIPIFPKIGGSLGDEYAPQVDPRCHYPAGDSRAAAHAVREMLASPVPVRNEWRRRARALAEAHRFSRPEQTTADFVRLIAARPRRSREPDGRRRSRLSDAFPLGLITRAFPSALWR